MPVEPYGFRIRGVSRVLVVVTWVEAITPGGTSADQGHMEAGSRRNTEFFETGRY